MGTSARQIEREIKETRERLDANLDELEGRAASSAVRYGRIAAIVAAAAVVAGVGFVIYRRTRKPNLHDRLDAVSTDRLRELTARIKREFPSVTVTVNEKRSREPGLVESIARKVAPSLVTTATGAVIDRMARSRAHEESRTVAAKGR